MAAPLPIRVCFLNMFEPTGPVPGEARLLRERWGLEPRYPFAAGRSPIFVNDAGVAGTLTGVGTGPAAVTVTHLVHDDRFDWRETYWIIAGIAGANPRLMSLGSVAWARWVVDTDLAHEIDPREAPLGWSHYLFPLDSDGPDAPPPPRGEHELFVRDEVVALHGGLAEWAVRVSGAVSLADLPTAESVALGRRYGEEAAAPPRVLLGDTVSGQRFWHGWRTHQWAEQWMTRWTNGAGRFATTAMEDTGTIRALQSAAKLGLVHPDRILLARGASNFTYQPPGVTALDSLRGTGTSFESKYPGYLPALRALERTVSAVTEALLQRGAGSAMSETEPPPI